MNQPPPRAIRVFISSTFRDMQAEREELVKRVFPIVRKRCESRGVAWSEIDLRWGITEEQAAEGRVLPICLAEIERCRPFFIGLLGERYGWIPDAVPSDLVERSPWLASAAGRSVTEIEMYHGALNDPASAPHAHFYLRDPSVAARVPAAHRRVFTEEPTPEEVEALGAEAAGRLAAGRQAKLDELKRRIRASGLPVREGFRDAAELGRLVLDDLTAVVDRLFPEGSRPDPLDQDAEEHEAFARSRARVYIARPALEARIDAHVSGTGAPLVVTGESGAGKSALVAHWVRHWRDTHPADFVFSHHVGGTPQSAEWRAIVTRLLGEIRRRFRLDRDLPVTADEIGGALAAWLPSTSGRVVIVIDALDQLDPRDDGPALAWLPAAFPPNVRVVLSTLEGHPLEMCRRREWPTLEVARLDAAERARLVVAHLASYGKALPESLAARVVAAPAAGNPLFLTALLEELRVFGSHEELVARLDHYLASPSLPALFQAILARWEQDYESARPQMIREALSAIAMAQRGLSEPELLDLLGEPGRPLPRAHWTPFALAAEAAFSSRGGRLSLFHRYLQQAVTDRYLRDRPAQAAVRLRLADYFEARGLDERHLDEVPHQLVFAEAWDRASAWLTDPVAFNALVERDWQTAHFLWLWAARRSGLDMASMSRTRLDAWVAGEADVRQRVAATRRVALLEFHTGRRDEALIVYRRALDTAECELGPDAPDTASCMADLAEALRMAGRLAEAEPLARRALAIREKALGPASRLTRVVRSELGRILIAREDWAGALPVWRRAVAIAEQDLVVDPAIGEAAGNLGLVLERVGDSAGAERYQRQAVAFLERVFGRSHAETARAISNLGILLARTGQSEPGEALVREALAIEEKVLGKTHERIADTAFNVGLLALGRGDAATAEPELQRAVSVAEQALGRDHATTGRCLAHLALAQAKTASRGQAVATATRALAVLEAALGASHPMTATAAFAAGEAHMAIGNPAAAETPYRRALAVREAVLGRQHPDSTLAAVQLLGSLVARKIEAPSWDLLRTHLSWIATADPATLNPYQRQAREALAGHIKAAMANRVQPPPAAGAALFGNSPSPQPARVPLAGAVAAAGPKRAGIAVGQPGRPGSVTRPSPPIRPGQGSGAVPSHGPVAARPSGPSASVLTNRPPAFGNASLPAGAPVVPPAQMARLRELGALLDAAPGANMVVVAKTIAAALLQMLKPEMPDAQRRDAFEKATTAVRSLDNLKLIPRQYTDAVREIHSIVGMVLARRR